MRFLILGPAEVRSNDGTPVAITAPRAISLLTMLLLRRSDVIAADEIAEALWPDKSPRRQSSALRFHIWKLRDALEPDRPARSNGTLVRKAGPGYVIDLTDHTLDVLEFEEQLDLARRTLPMWPAESHRIVVDALSLFRGEPLCDVRYAEFAQPEIRRLDALRLEAELLRMDALLALDRCVEAVAALEALTAQHPFAEALWAQLMTALARSGRRGDALRAYQRARLEMADALGIEPSRTLRDLEERILLADVASPVGPDARSVA